MSDATTMYEVQRLGDYGDWQATLRGRNLLTMDGATLYYRRMIAEWPESKWRVIRIVTTHEDVTEILPLAPIETVSP